MYYDLGNNRNTERIMVSTTLVTLAHPDDECAVGPGTIAHLVSLGERVVLYYATRGEGGISGRLEAGMDWISPKELADLRSRELKHVVEVLGASRSIVRDFGDGRLDSQYLSEPLRNDIWGVLEEIRPDKVITFPPSGLTGHDDHRAVSLATVEAAQRYSGNTQLFCRVVKDHQGFINAVHDGLHARYRVSVEQYQKTIDQVMRAHHSQVHSMAHIFPSLRDGGGVEDLWSYEYFSALPYEK
jgi:LmbE family N-acetylglucosaminyl deacetylase